MTKAEMLAEARKETTAYLKAKKEEDKAKKAKETAYNRMKELGLKCGTEIEDGAFRLDLGDGRVLSVFYRPRVVAAPGALKVLDDLGLLEACTKRVVEQKLVEAQLIMPDTPLTEADVRKILIDMNQKTSREAAITKRASVYNLKVLEVA